MKTKLSNIELAFILLVTFALYLACNIMTPMVVDDCSYAATSRSLAAIWERQSHDYFTCNGRLIAHSVAQFWGAIAGKSVFNFFNPMAMCLMVWLIGGGVWGCKKVRPDSLALAVLLMWFFSPDQYVTQFMIAGSMNYIWASVLMLLFILLYNKTGEEKTSVWSWIGLALFALLVGAWSDIYAVCVIPAGCLYLWWNRKEHPVTRQKVIMIISYCLGAAFVVLAPGNFSRQENLTSSTPMSTRFVNTLVYVIDSPLLWLWIIMILLWFIQRKRLEHFWRDNSFWLMAALFSVIFGIFSGASWPRTHFPAYLFTFLLLVKLESSLELRPWFNHIATAIVLTIVAIDFSMECPTLKKQKSAVEYVKEHADHEGVTIPWNGCDGSRKSISSACFSCYSTNWRNVAFAQYHKLPPFKVVPLEVMNYVLDSSISCNRFTVVRLPEKNSEIKVLRIIYSDELLYKYPSKLARLVASFGYPLTERIFTTKEEAPLNGAFLKRQQGLDAFCRRQGDESSTDGLGIIITDNGTFAYYPSFMNRFAGLDAIRTELNFQ